VTGRSLGLGRRWGAIVLFRLAGAMLRNATALYQRRTISSAELRAALAAATLFERAGAAIALGRQSRRDPDRAKKDEDRDEID
jgi:hypothetical protein